MYGVATKIWTDQFVVDDYNAALDLDSELDHDIGWRLLLCCFQVASVRSAQQSFFHSFCEAAIIIDVFRSLAYL